MRVSGEHRCERKSKPEYNFIRTFFCSLERNHEGGHTAYWNHDSENTSEPGGPVAWGPDSGWEDDGPNTDERRVGSTILLQVQE